jgi:hypothetical protein
MLRPGDQRLLVDAVRAPAGYSLDHALITTYSLDLTALLSIPLALTFSDWEEEGGRPRVDPVALLEAVRRNATRLTVACQAGEIAVPASQRNLFAFLEPAVRQIRAPKGGVFHPKVWVLRYLPREAGPVLYRVLCASRNLTFDRSWDVLLVLEGEVRGKRGRSLNRPLSDFVGRVAGLADQPGDRLDGGRREALAQLAAEVRRAEFSSPQGTSLKGFHPLGFGRSDPFAGRRDRMLVISPFVGPGQLAELATPGAVLVSSSTELDALQHSPEGLFDEVLILDDAALSEASSPDTPTGEDGTVVQARAERLGDSAEGLLRGLHAKIYVADAGHRPRIWIGSANATDAAFTKNVEFLVELEGDSRAKVGALLGDTEGLRKILKPYRRGEQSQADRDRRSAGFLVDAAAHTLADAEIGLRISADGTKQMAELILPESLPDELDGLDSVAAWPITLHEDRRLRVWPGAGEPLVWRDLAVEQVSAFVGFELAARVGSARVVRRVTVMARLEGLPEDRDGAVMRSVLRSPEQLLRYLAFLLADPDNDRESAIEMLDLLDPDKRSSGVFDGELQAGLPLFEGLVRAYDRDPERIDRVAELVERLERSQYGRELIPPEFKQIWEPVLAARASRGKAK